MSASMNGALRDIGILAHIDAGKTSLTERILFVSGCIRSAGDIEDGTTTTDYLDVERRRGITVKAAAAHLEWASARSAGSSLGGAEAAVPTRVRINLIDTPGHVDFSSEVGRSLRALDGAVVLVCAVAGVQTRTEALYRACLRRAVARLAFVNKMDRRGASFERALGDLRDLDPGVVAVQLPWGEGESFHGVVDLVEMKAYDFSAGSVPHPGSVPGRLAPEPIPASLEGAAAIARAALVERLADGDAGLFEDYVVGRPVPADRIRSALREATIAGRATPTLCGSAFSDGAAALLLEAVADYLPAPGEAARPGGTELGTGNRVVLGPGDPFSALVFKTASDPSLGRLSWIRVRSGKVAAGDKVLDSGAGVLVRVSRIFGIQADALEAADGAGDGDIVALAFSGSGTDPSRGGAVVGSTGATLCDPGRPVLYEPIVFEEPVVSVALEPRTREDGERLRAGAAALAEEDPSIRLREDPQTGRIELSGMGELHLEVAIDRLARDFGARARTGKPRVEYRERLQADSRGVEDFDRDLGGERARASVALGISPAEGGVSFEDDPSFRSAPALAEAARRGAESALSFGPAAGFPLEGVRVSLSRIVLPGGQASNPGKASLRAVEIAASLAAGSALRAAGARIVEPVMRIEIEVPDAFLGLAAAAVKGRGGRIESMDSTPDGGRIVAGAAPLRCLFGFAGQLRTETEGRAAYSARFLHYEIIPPGLVDVP